MFEKKVNQKIHLLGKDPLPRIFLIGITKLDAEMC